MTVVKLQAEPQYQELFEALVERTKEGKIEWDETAQPSTYIAAVKGHRSFEISARVRHDARSGQLEDEAYYVLVVKDEGGNTLLRTPYEPCDSARELYELARRVAENVDERIDSTLDFLRSL